MTCRYMCPELLCVLNELKNDHQHVGRVDVVDGMLEANDAFGCGCVVGFLCSRGMHPFGHANRRDVPKNILANKRNLECLCEIKEPRHLELLNRLTAHELTQRWTVTYAHSHSRIFDTLSVASISTRNDFGNNAGILIDTIQFHERPSGSCRDQLLRPDLVSDFPKLPALVDKIEAVLRNEPRFSSRQARSRLDQNSCVDLILVLFLMLTLFALSLSNSPLCQRVGRIYTAYHACLNLAGLNPVNLLFGVDNWQFFHSRTTMALTETVIYTTC